MFSADCGLQFAELLVVEVAAHAVIDTHTRLRGQMRNQPLELRFLEQRHDHVDIAELTSDA